MKHRLSHTPIWSVLARALPSVSTLIGLIAPALLAQTSQQRPPDPDDARALVAEVTKSRRFKPWEGKLTLPGCPPENLRARALVDAFVAEELPASVRTQLAGLWKDEIAACGYSPLEDWYYRTLIDAAYHDDLEMAWLMYALPTRVPDAWAEPLWELAADTALAGNVRSSVAIRITGALKTPDRLRVLRERAGQEGIPLTWATWQARLILRERGSAFFDEAVQLIQEMDDPTAAAILSPIYAAVDSGKFAPSDPSLTPVRRAVEGRPGLASLVGRLGGR